MTPFTSRAGFDAAHPRALALYCSDGRFTDAVEELLHHLGYPRLDTLTLPGGPGVLNFWAGSLLEADQMERAARFLIRGHDLQHVVLLAHAGCGYYRQKLGARPAAAVKEAQVADLRVAARAIRAARTGIDVTLCYATPEGGRVRFDPVTG